MKKILVWTAFLAVLGAGSAAAQDKSLDTTARYFLIQVSIANQQEVAAGRLAAAQGGSAEVKAFGNRMVADHGKAQAQLMELVKTKGLAIPPAATENPVDDPILKKLHGSEFDKMYVHRMVPGHRETVGRVEKYALTGKDPDVRAFAQQTLPVVKDHLMKIEAIDSAMSK